MLKCIKNSKLPLQDHQKRVVDFLNLKNINNLKKIDIIADNNLIDDKKKDEALKFLPKLNSELMKIAKTGIIKKQNASRNVSRITKKISTI